MRLPDTHPLKNRREDGSLDHAREFQEKQGALRERPISIATGKVPGSQSRSSPPFQRLHVGPDGRSVTNESPWSPWAQERLAEEEPCTCKYPEPYKTPYGRFCRICGREAL